MYDGEASAMSYVYNMYVADFNPMFIFVHFVVSVNGKLLRDP